MKQILVTSAGGPAATSFIRSLREDPDTIYFIAGTDADRASVFLSEADETYLIPRADDPDYIPTLIRLCNEFSLGFIHSQNDDELHCISENRERLYGAGIKLFLPSKFDMRICRDKWLSYCEWKKDPKLRLPRTFLLSTERDLRDAYAILGDLDKGIWIRDTVGAAGRGSLSNPTYNEAIDHLNKRNAWGKATAAAHLTNRTVTWQSIWDKGWLVVAQGRARDNWAFGNRTQSGVTGLTGVGRTVSDPEVDRVATRAIHAINPHPHGIWSVDMTYAPDGALCPTEINCGRFFTTHHFITKAGCNMPKIAVELAYEEYKGKYRVINPCIRDLYWIRGIDSLPQMVLKETLEGVKERRG